MIAEMNKLAKARRAVARAGVSALPLHGHGLPDARPKHTLGVPEDKQERKTKRDNKKLNARHEKALVELRDNARVFKAYTLLTMEPRAELPPAVGDGDQKEKKHTKRKGNKEVVPCNLDELIKNDRALLRAPEACKSGH